MIMTWFISFSLIMALALASPGGLQAAVVGKIIQVEGHVDLLKQGKMPTVPAKVDQELEQGDVIRTKSNSKAQVRFVDDTTLTLAPGTRVAIDQYLYDAEKKERQGVLQVFRGMVEAVVTKLVKAEKPDLIMKTHTAVMGVRGTKWFAVLDPTDTDVYNEEGKLEIRNILPEIVGEVVLGKMRHTRIGVDVPPTVPMTFTSDELLLLKQQLSKGTGTRAGGGFQMPSRSGQTQLSLAALNAVYNPMVNPVNDPRTVTFAVPPTIKPLVIVTPTPTPTIV
jgi:hypothetical protein